ncbi:MAG TPA: recombinase family protein [Nitrospira sp.]|jgi:site-specific DNA recombinase|nr:recombinase family protein [Nitrospira sp.]
MASEGLSSPITSEGNMHAAIYVRKSTAQTGMSEDARSVERQKARAHAYAAARGWAVADEHVYEDDGISGAEFERRPGFQQLLSALKRRAPFRILIVMDESRLGRESIETAHVLKQFSLSGIRIFAYLDNREIVLDNLMDKMRLAFTGLMDEGERYRAQQRTFDAMHRKALLGHVTGGRVYGFDNVEILSSVMDAYGRPKRDHVERRINQAQAAVVCKIFRLCAAGKGMVSIARLLNDEGLPAPRNSVGRRISWSPSSVRSVLFRRLYLGELIWNKTKKRNPWGIQQQRKRPEKDWVKLHLPHLQIVSEADWKAAHDRLSATRSVYLRGTKGELWGRPASNLDSKYLLTGLIKCGLCGGSVYVKSSFRKGARAYFYGCMTYHLRGRTACSNRHLAPMDAANEAVLGVFGKEVLHPDVTDTVVRKALDKFRASQKEKRHNRERYHQQISAVDAESGRLVAAVAAGGDIPALVQALQQCNDRKTALLEALSELDHRQELDQTDYDELEKELRAHFRTSWQTMMTRQVAPTRQILGKLFNGNRIPLTPVEGEEGIYFEFKGMASIGRLLTGRTKEVVSPTGFEPVLLP